MTLRTEAETLAQQLIDAAVALDEAQALNAALRAQLREWEIAVVERVQTIEDERDAALAEVQRMILGSA